MKRTICLIIALVIVLSCTVGCTVEGLPEGMSGSNAIKIMLAKERLDSNVLNAKGNIFDEGVEVLTNLAYITEQSFLDIVSGSQQYLIPEGSLENAMTDVVKFDEISNSYQYFENRTSIITSIAKSGAELIDYVKKNIRIVDTWISKDKEYYLHVDENSETLYSRTDFQVNMCKRYKNSVGKNVYEVWIDNEIATNYILYIPGERFELTEHMKSYGDYLCFVAENSKGYWQMFTTSSMPERTDYELSCLVMKSNIVCETRYNSGLSSIGMLNVISADKKTDIFSISDLNSDSAWITICLNGFDGISSVGNSSITFNNGVSFNVGDQYKNILISNAFISETAYGDEGKLMISINEATKQAKLDALVDFINHCGLQCRRDLTSVINGISSVENEANYFINNYVWNGYSIRSNANVTKAFNVEKQKIKDNSSAYNEIKDLTVIDYDKRANADFLINFAPIASNTQNNVTYANGKVSVDSISLTIDDTTLYVVDEPYIVNFALSSSAVAGSAGLINIDLGEVASTKYNDTSSFTVSAEGISFNIPSVASGSYTLVAYISTADGIRASEYIPVKFTSITGNTINSENISMTVSSVNDSLLIKSEVSKTIYHSIEYRASMTYTELFDTVSEFAFVYGIPGDAIEMLTTSGSYSTLSASAASIEAGTYRMSYTHNNGVSSDYIYVTVE